MYWVRTEDGGAVNLEQADSIWIENPDTQGNPYRLFAGDRNCLCKSPRREDCQAARDELIAKLLLIQDQIALCRERAVKDAAFGG